MWARRWWAVAPTLAMLAMALWSPAQAAGPASAAEGVQAAGPATAAEGVQPTGAGARPVAGRRVARAGEQDDAAPAAAPTAGAAGVPLRVGVLRFGTVNWELDVMRHHGFAAERGLTVDVVPLASKSALTLALQAGEIDLMVGDWLWVVGKRQRGASYTFVPYSLAVGSLMVSDPAIRQLGDLRGRTIGVSGGPDDKSWILLRAYAREAIGEDLAAVTDQLFAPPPLLGDLIGSGELDAVVTNWNYGVRFAERGGRTLLEVADILPQLGIDEPIPLLGWVFDAERAAARERALRAFFCASYEAKHLLAESDREWQRLRPLLGLGPEASVDAMREGYRAGIPQAFTDKESAAVAAALEVLVVEAGARALGLSSSALPEGTFWDEGMVPPCSGAP